MPGPTKKTVGLEMPDDFPCSPYDAIHKRVSGRFQNPSDLLDQYLGAWNAIAYRFASCTAHDTRFTETTRRVAGSPGHEDRYVQDDALFGFFVTGLSSIESFFYGLHAIAAVINGGAFPMQTEGERRKVTPEKTIDRFASAFPADSILIAFNQIGARNPQQPNQWLDTPAYGEWKSARNILAHRVAPGRILYGTTAPIPTPDAVVKELNIPINETTTSGRRQWLASTLTALMQAAENFASSRL